MDLRRCVDTCVNLINGEDCGWNIASKDRLSGKTWEYLWKGYNPYQQEYPLPEKNEEQTEDIFTFQIKVDGRTVMEKNFTGDYYPPKVKYDVDIRKTIPKIVREIQETLSVDNPITMYGEGKIRRDYIFVTDAVKGLILVAEKGTDPLYFIGSGVPRSLKDIFGFVIETVGMGRIEQIETPEFHRKVGTGDFWVDNKKICSLGWSLEVELIEGIQRTADYYRENPELLDLE